MLGTRLSIWGKVHTRIITLAQAEIRVLAEYTRAVPLPVVPRRLIKPKRIYRKNAEFEPGARIRSALAVLRVPSSPLTVRKIVAHVLAERGTHTSEPGAVTALSNVISHSLRQYACRGLVATVGSAPRRWQVVR